MGGGQICPEDFFGAFIMKIKRNSKDFCGLLTLKIMHHNTNCKGIAELKKYLFGDMCRNFY